MNIHIPFGCVLTAVEDSYSVVCVCVCVRARVNILDCVRQTDVWIIVTSNV